jgi:CRP-like cAMP-binding protein
MSARPDRLTILASNPFFGALPENDLARIAPLLREVSVPPGDFLVREGDRAVEVFIIDDGEMQVLKRHPGDGRLQEISRLGPGQSVGELALIDEAPRSASVRALTLTRLYALAVADVAEAGAAAVIRTRLTQAVTRRLRDTNELTAQALALQLAMGRFLTFIIFLLSLYAYVLSGLSHIATRSISTTPITLGLSTLLIGVSFSMMRRLGYPLAFYGLTARGWRPAPAPEPSSRWPRSTRSTPRSRSSSSAAHSRVRSSSSSAGRAVTGRRSSPRTSSSPPSTSTSRSASRS